MQWFQLWWSPACRCIVVRRRRIYIYRYLLSPLGQSTRHNIDPKSLPNISLNRLTPLTKLPTATNPQIRISVFFFSRKTYFRLIPPTQKKENPQIHCRTRQAHHLRMRDFSSSLSLTTNYSWNLGILPLFLSLSSALQPCRASLASWSYRRLSSSACSIGQLLLLRGRDLSPPPKDIAPLSFTSKDSTFFMIPGSTR